MLADTTFWIDLIRERQEGIRGPVHRFIASHRNQTLQVSVITWGELAEGFAHHADLESFLGGVRVLMLPRHVAWEASRIQRELGRSGGRLGENDLWIAATARSWGHRLVTRDRAFERVPRINLVRY